MATDSGRNFMMAVSLLGIVVCMLFAFASLNAAIGYADHYGATGFDMVRETVMYLQATVWCIGAIILWVSLVPDKSND